MCCLRESLGVTLDMSIRPIWLVHHKNHRVEMTLGRNKCEDATKDRLVVGGVFYDGTLRIMSKHILVSARLLSSLYWRLKARIAWRFVINPLVEAVYMSLLK